MADPVSTFHTSLQSDEVLVRAVQFFASEKFRASGQSDRIATFDGRPPIPWGMILLTVLGFMLCVIPGVILYIMVIRKVYRFQNLIVTATPSDEGTEVTISHPAWAGKSVNKFFKSLPPVMREQQSS